MKLRKLKDNIRAAVDLTIVLMIGITFAGLMVMAYIIFEIQDQLIDENTSATVNNSIKNITSGFDNAVNFLLIAITIFIRNMRKHFVFIVSGVTSYCNSSVTYVTRPTIKN